MLGHSPKENPRRLGQGLGQVRPQPPLLITIECLSDYRHLELVCNHL